MLETGNEVESDALLVQLVRARLISERVNDLPWSDAVIAGVGSNMTVPVAFYLKSLEAALREVKASIPAALSDNRKLTVC